MRNGNLLLFPLLVLFLFVLILPMRNGNFSDMFFLLLLFIVLILPMRNGNNYSSIFDTLDTNSSYPTYEEWKHLLGYEIAYSQDGSYPTYEEWKQCILYYNRTFTYYVLILPMRNGNTSEFKSHLGVVVKFLSYL